MANDDVLIVGKLDDKALLDSIDDLIRDVSDKSTVMANKFKQSMDIMKDAMKDFAVTQKVSVDLMKESWREMSASFDAMLKAQQEGTGGGKGSGKGRYDDGTLGQYREETKEIERQREDLKLNSDELREQNRIIAERKRMLKEQTTDLATLRLDRTMRMPSGDLDEATRKLRVLEAIQRRYAGTTELSEQQQKKLADAIARCKREIDRFNSAKPKSLKDVLGMDESTLDGIAKKMRALRTVSIDPNNKQQVHELGNEYARLSRLQAELMGKGIQLTHANNYLAQSFGYIRNRIVYALTLGAVTNFTKQIYEVRGQYELLERSLGILIDDMRRGSELFNELNAMALKSPFTLMELATGAKQLLAYNFAEEEVVDTTRRLADISAALGVPMERLVYNLGQIRAQTALTARDARDFANAGLAIVPMLAQMYTEEKRFGDEIVTTAQVFDMMSKKMVSYADVMKVINKVTDEGGKFFDFQAKQAETLRVKMANLTLSWNNMLNEIGQDNQQTLTMPLNGLKLLFENWRRVYDIIKDIVVLYGIYRARAILVSLVNGTLITQAYISGMYNFGRAIRYVTAAWRTLSVAVATNPLGAVAAVVAACAASFLLFGDSVDDAIGGQERFGRSGAKVISDAESMFDSLSGLSHESSNYKKILGELNSILNEYDIELIKETDSIEEVNKKRAVAISLIKQETLERKYLNDVQQGRDEYQSKVEDIRKNLRASLGDAITENFLGIGTVNEEIAKNAPAIANIVSDVIERNISTIAGKTGDEYEKGVEKIFAEIDSRMKAIGISEETRSKGWLENSVFRAFKDDIITKAIDDMVEARQKLDDYTDALEKNYEAEQKAAEKGASFNDRVEQTQTRLMKAANDTDNFAKKIEQLLKQYGGENIIDFLVKVKTEVPAWMSQKGLTELTQLSARFTALATNAKKAGKTSLNVNGTEFSVEQLFQRAAQYTQAAQNKAKDIESRRSSTITREASEALKQYKSALEAATIAQNKFNRGKADQALVTEKQTEAQKAYDKALEKGVSLEDLRKAKNGGKGSGSKKDPLGDALTKEIQLISDIQKMYKDYQRAGVDADTARIASAKEYEKTLKATNNTLSRFGIKGLSGEELATMDMRSLRDFYEKLRKDASDKGNTKGVEALEKAIRSLNIEITKVDYKKITDGLNNELGKIKEDYELAVELDANPELGNMFADMFDIDTSTLPHTFEQALAKVQEAVNKSLSEMSLKKSFDVLKDDVDVFAKAVGQSLDGETIKGLKNAQNYIRGIWKKSIEDTSKDWNTLIEKYGSLQDKILKIYKDNVQQQAAIVRKFGTNDEQVKALDLINKIKISQDPTEISRLQEELSKVMKDVTSRNPVALKVYNAAQAEQANITGKTYWENFKESDLYSMTFTDMANNSTKAIQLIIDKLNDLKDKVGEDPASMKALIKSLEDAEDELQSRDPFGGIVSSISEWTKATREQKEAQEELERANLEVAGSEVRLKNAQSIKDKKEIANAEQRLVQAQERQANAQKKVIVTNNNARKALAKLSKSMQGIVDAAQDMGSLLGSVSKVLRFAGADDAADAIDAINEGLTMMITVIMAVDAAIKLVTSTNPYLLAIAAALSIIVGLVSFLSGNSNKKITEQVEASERAVKRLEIAYIDLEQAVNKAYGAAVIGAQQAALANKKLQLDELKRQIELEKSRDSKHYDADKILDLQKQYKELFYEIENGYRELVDNLMGTSSTDFAENLVSSMIDAFKSGEDYMAVFNEKFDEMIDNMIMKSIVSRVVSQYIDNIWDSLDERINERSKKESLEYANAQNELSRIRNMNDEEIRRELWGDVMPNEMAFIDYLMHSGEEVTQSNLLELRLKSQEWANQQVEDFKKAADEMEKAAKERLDAASAFTDSDIDYVMGKFGDVMPELGEKLKNILGEYYKFGESSETQLSALQQGIQGVTETTAGALEAYMNGVSQQSYLQSELITQIRDAVVGFNFDVQIATMSQMLLQLQQSYQVQSAIQEILGGWSNPSGMAVRVEMI